MSNVPNKHHYYKDLASVVHEKYVKTCDDSSDDSSDDTNDVTSVAHTIVHRLDMDTSGVMMYSLKKSSTGRLCRLFRDKVVVKTYEALVNPTDCLVRRIEEGGGCDEEGNCRSVLGDGLGDGLGGVIEKQMTRDVFNVPFMREYTADYAAAVREYMDMDSMDMDKSGRIRRKHLNKIVRRSESMNTITEYRILGKTMHDGKLLIRIQLNPITGKTHQLRLACLLGLNTTIYNDCGYGEGTGTGMCLHSKSIEFQEEDGERIRVECDAPW
jgi:23S rRNA-/tRNA-specific pseudouridylate synthase